MLNTEYACLYSSRTGKCQPVPLMEYLLLNRKQILNHAEKSVQYLLFDLTDTKEAGMISCQVMEESLRGVIYFKEGELI